VRLRRRLRVAPADFWSHQQRLREIDRRFYAAREFSAEMALWPTPLASWLLLLGDVTEVGRDIREQPAPRWHFVPDAHIYGGGASGRPGRRGWMPK